MYVQYGLSDIVEKCHFRVPKNFGILFGDLRQSTWASQYTYIDIS